MFSYPAAEKEEEEDESYEDFELEEDEALALDASHELDPESLRAITPHGCNWLPMRRLARQRARRATSPKEKGKAW